jgi:carbonic anhydrase
MGHTRCGAIKASFECHDLDNLQGVISDIENAKAALKGLDAKDLDLVAESNVRLQIRRLLDCSEIIREAVRKDKLEVVGAMFDIATGVARFI